MELRDIRVSFGGVHAVDGVTIDLYPGEVVALVGGNGAGKSTLIHTLAGAHPADDGQIFINGEPVTIKNSPRCACARGRGDLPEARVGRQPRCGGQRVPRTRTPDAVRFPRRLGDVVGHAEADGPAQPSVQEPPHGGEVALGWPAPVGGDRPGRALQRQDPDHGRAHRGARPGRDRRGARSGRCSSSRKGSGSS